MEKSEDMNPANKSDQSSSDSTMSFLLHFLSVLVVFTVQSIDVSLSPPFSVRTNQFWQTSRYKKPNLINYSGASDLRNLNEPTLFSQFVS